MATSATTSPAASAAPQAAAQAAEPATRSGLDLAHVDTSVRPQDDLFGHINGGWLVAHEIPADRSSDGAFRALYDAAEEQVRAIVEEAAASAPVEVSGPASGGALGQVGRAYRAFMDVERVEALGATPLEPLLAEVAAVRDRSALAALLGTYQREGLAALVAAYVSPDAKDSSRYVVYAEQAGLGLPDEAYYRLDEHAEVRGKYLEHLDRLCALAGLEPLGATVLDLETALAGVSWDRVSRRDAHKTYTLMTWEALVASAPGFDWEAWRSALLDLSDDDGEGGGKPTSRLDGVSADALAEVVVRQPSFVTGAAALFASRPLEQWRAWLAVRLVRGLAPYLSEALVEEQFDFSGRTLSGTPQLRERWRRGVSFVEGTLGEAIGQLYVERHFPPRSKERMVELVANLVEAYRRSISTLDWMGPETREKALAKLAAFTPKIGYPDRWKDYSSLAVDGEDLVGTVRRTGEWETAFELAKIGQPIDRSEWLMTPQTVNAYYHPVMNEIVFPAAILQPPFFDADADDAANYGGIGAVIGHEIGHGFDDQGSKYDGSGNLVDWWQPSDREEFERRAGALIAQYAALSPREAPDAKVNGELTVGENIGDLGGLTIALKAYRIALENAGLEEGPELDGFTAIQRVLIGWAQVWRTKTREAEVRRRLAIDPHSPADLRCNAVVTNLDAFHEAFGVVEGDGLFTPREQRVRIW
ncbi:putative endopeptidase [Quadrisphaera granulorum]|uniref:Putative endopeptidase n=1 Tax=Quadrisphaera granulorum TaxID=317664 RepID=A0A316A4Z5_9ACTN|nr:M13-type metalloendopeptidase [Quadrisphaera granulorum]PWJ52765.1 putative endopeptidase [Quadrisphaera granulorum]SZE97370.1 putative endopeptidase [Quadrisphaera granulorum]